MAPTPLEGLAVAATVALIGSIYVLVLSTLPSPPSPPPPPSSPIPTQLSTLLPSLTYPLHLLLPHLHLPFLPLTYLLSLLYTVLYPALVLLRAGAYCLWAPLAGAAWLAHALYPLYVLCGVAALVGLGIGSGWGGVARLVWLVGDAS